MVSCSVLEGLTLKIMFGVYLLIVVGHSTYKVVYIVNKAVYRKHHFTYFLWYMKQNPQLLSSYPPVAVETKVKWRTSGMSSFI